MSLKLCMLLLLRLLKCFCYFFKIHKRNFFSSFALLHSFSRTLVSIITRSRWTTAVYLNLPPVFFQTANRQIFESSTRSGSRLARETLQSSKNAPKSNRLLTSVSLSFSIKHIDLISLLSVCAFVNLDNTPDNLKWILVSTNVFC